MKYKIVAVLLLTFVFFTSIYAQDRGDVAVIPLKGHLNESVRESVESKVQMIVEKQIETVVVEVNSTSGDLREVLAIAKILYELKLDENLKLVVYIDSNALGPAAIIPFLADELTMTAFMSWGDIMLGSEGTLPLNILRSRLSSLIAEESPDNELLNMVAEGMMDSSLALVEHQGIVSKSKDGVDGGILSPAGEALVLNQKQVRRLGLTAYALDLQAFKKQYALTEEQIEDMEKPVISTREALTKLPDEVLESLRYHIPYNDDDENLVGHIVIDNKKSGIDQSTWIYVSSALEYYKKLKPKFIILELNTPGGEVFASQKISDALKEMDTNLGIHVVAFVNNWAVSAGAMLTYSCRYIAIAKDATMGAAEPVLPTGDGGMQTASEKINSALRTDFANRASFFGRNPLIAEAMVDKDKILVLRHGEIIELESDEGIVTGGHDPDFVITKEGKLLTLDAQDMMHLGIADFMVEPQKIEAITAKEKDAGRWPARKSLVFTHPYFATMSNAEIVSYNMDWKVAFIAFLSSFLLLYCSRHCCSISVCFNSVARIDFY